MNKKKYLAWFCDFESSADFSKFVNVHSLLITKFSEKFDKIYLINVLNLKFFSQKNDQISFELDQSLNLPSNIKFYNPINSKEFENFLVGKILIGIHNFGRSLRHLKVLFLIARHKIKLVQISNIGNLQLGMSPLKNFFWKGLLYKFKHIYTHKFIVLLSNLGLVPKIEIRFVTDPNIIEYKKKSKNLLKKIFNYFNLHYAREFVLINGRAFDTVKESQIEIEENQIILLDEMMDNYQWISLRKKTDSKNLEKHYYYLIRLLKHLSNIYKKEVVICIHPMDNLEKKKRLFADFRVIKYQTRKYIFKAFLVLFTESSAIVDAILLKKRIVSFYSSYMDENMIKHTENYAENIGTVKINIEDEITFNKDDFLLKLDKAKEKYLNFIESRIVPDGNNLGYEKIIKTLKERFF